MENLNVDLKDWELVNATSMCFEEEKEYAVFMDFVNPQNESMSLSLFIPEKIAGHLSKLLAWQFEHNPLGKDVSPYAKYRLRVNQTITTEKDLKNQVIDYYGKANPSDGVNKTQVAEYLNNLDTGPRDLYYRAKKESYLFDHSMCFKNMSFFATYIPKEEAEKKLKELNLPYTLIDFPFYSKKTTPFVLNHYGQHIWEAFPHVFDRGDKI